MPASVCAQGDVEDSIFVDNRAGTGGGAIVFDDEPVVNPLNRFNVINSQFERNSVVREGRGGAIGIAFSGIGTNIVDIQDSEFRFNEANGLGVASTGGALDAESYLANGTRITLSNSTFCDNLAEAAGGAIHTEGELSLSGVTFCNNTVATANTARLGGGAIAHELGELEVLRSTFSNNAAQRGGAISVDSGRFVMRNSTIVRPTMGVAGSAGSALRLNSGVSADVLALHNNIIIGSCSYADASFKPDNARNNIEATGDTCRLGIATGSSGNLLNTSIAAVKLATLADNGGPTHTFLPEAGSLALDAALNSNCPALDQRGYVRTDATCDIGAIEVGAQISMTQVFADGFE